MLSIRPHTVLLSRAFYELSSLFFHGQWTIYRGPKLLPAILKHHCFAFLQGNGGYASRIGGITCM